jgi:hypothetical protein
MNAKIDYTHITIEPARFGQPFLGQTPKMADTKTEGHIFRYPF